MIATKSKANMPWASETTVSFNAFLVFVLEITCMLRM
jgi:hypothetical protein